MYKLNEEQQRFVNLMYEALDRTNWSNFNTTHWGCEQLVRGKHYTLSGQEAQEYERLNIAIFPCRKPFRDLRIIHMDGKYTIEVIQGEVHNWQLTNHSPEMFYISGEIQFIVNFAVPRRVSKFIKVLFKIPYVNQK